MALVPTDSRFVIVPYLGTSRPSDATIIQNGMQVVRGSSAEYIGVVKASNNGWVVATTYGNIYTALFTLISSYKHVSDVSTTSTTISDNITYNSTRYYYDTFTAGWYPSELGSTPKFTAFDDILPALSTITPPEGYMNIKYSIQNGSIIAPSFVAPGGNITGYITMAPGFSLTQQDISITRNGTAIPFAYSNGVLTFTAPSS